MDIPDKSGNMLVKKRRRTEEDIGGSSSPGNGFVAHVTDFNLNEDPTKVEHSTSQNQNRFVTIKLTNDSIKKRRLYISKTFLTANGMTNPGSVTLVGRNGERKFAKLLKETSGRMSLGKGWKEFAIENEIGVGDLFTLESIGKDPFPVLLLRRDYCSKAGQKEIVSTEPKSGNKNNREERRYIYLPTLNRLVTLTLEPEDVTECTLFLPSEFMIANGLDKLGKIIFLGKEEIKWYGYRVKRNGEVAVGLGWERFCKAQGVELGQSLTLKFIGDEDTAPVLRLLL